MKYSDTDPAIRNANIEYLKGRWEQLYGLERESTKEGIKYLFLVNSGASVAVLAFFGSVPVVRDLYWPKVMLFLFVIGVILVGVLNLAISIRMTSIFSNWRSLVEKYYTDAIGWKEALENDLNKSKPSKLIGSIAVASFSCFIAGTIVGMFNFSTLTSGESNVGKEAITATTKANTNPASSAVRAIDKEHPEPVK